MVNSEKASVPTFEQSLKRLEQIVTELERGDAPLEDSLAKYEEGVGRLKRCFSMLEEVEKKIILLNKKEDHSLEQTPFHKNPSEK